MASTEQGSALLHVRACAADAEGHHDAAAALWERALSLDPKNVSALVGLACVRFMRGAVAEADYLASQAVRLDERAHWGWTTIGRCATARAGSSETEEARREYLVTASRAFDMALKHEPFWEQVFDAAAAHFRLGDWESGWKLHSASNRGGRVEGIETPPDVPRWDGEPVARLLVCSWLGFGDVVMFSRWLPWAKSRARHLTVGARALEWPLYAPYLASGVIDALVDDERGQFDAHCENFALPELAGATLATLPTARPMRNRVVGKTIKVGIVWSGSDRTSHNPIRRVPLELLLPLAGDHRVQLFSLQVGPRAGDIARLGAQAVVRDLSGQVAGDWSLTARALQEMDLLVSCDTGTAHLAGAIGVPTFLMLSAFADWRWLVGREDCPWYPSVRIFRQHRMAEWAPVVERVGEEIRALLGGDTREEAA